MRKEILLILIIIMALMMFLASGVRTRGTGAFSYSSQHSVEPRHSILAASQTIAKKSARGPHVHFAPARDERVFSKRTGRLLRDLRAPT